jgi:hypothetical protein
MIRASFLTRYFWVSQNSRRMIITVEERPLSLNHLRFLLVLMNPTLIHDINSGNSGQLIALVFDLELCDNKLVTGLFKIEIFR